MAEKDLELVLNWRNSDRIRQHMYTDQLIELEDHRAWFERTKDNPDSVHLIFEQGERPLGVMNFPNIDRKNGKCLWGFYIGVEDASPGTGSVLGYLGLEYAFETLDLRKLVGEVFASNPASIKFHQRLGFVEEGRLVEHICKQGEFQDIVVFGLLERTWREIKTELTQQIFG